MRGIQLFLAGALVVLVGFGVMQNLELGRLVRMAGDAIAEREQEVTDIRVEKIRLEAEVSNLQESLAALDDTSRAARMGQFMREGESLAKQLDVLDGRETRAMRLGDAERERYASGRRRMLWTNVILAGAALIVVLTLAALRKIA